MDPLTEFAVGLKPELKSLIESDKTKAFEGKIAAAVREITNATDATTAQGAVDADTNLKAGLIALLGKLVGDEEEARKVVAGQSTTAQDKPVVSGTNRSTQPYTRLPATYAWVNPALSMIITAGFLVLVYLLLYKAPADVATNQVFNIALGALATAFATVIGFHFGSSVGSKEKDNLLAERVVENDARAAEPTT
jgi:hypothetical protein